MSTYYCQILHITAIPVSGQNILCSLRSTGVKNSLWSCGCCASHWCSHHSFMCLNQTWVWSKYKSFGYHINKSEENLSSYKGDCKALFPGTERVGAVSVTFSIKCSKCFHIFFILELIILNATSIEIVPVQDYFITITPDSHNMKEYKCSQDWISLPTPV